MGEAIITRRGGGGKLKYASGTSSGKKGSSGRREITVSGLAFKPYIVIAYRSSSTGVYAPSFVSLDDAGNKVLQTCGPNGSSSVLYTDVDQIVTDDGFTLKMGTNDYNPDATVLSIQWKAWGI